jgi:FKBP-type peptidyl-prolyl cis-trans isomerase SlyD
MAPARDGIGLIGVLLAAWRWCQPSLLESGIPPWQSEPPAMIPTIGPDTCVTLSYTLFDEHDEPVDRATASEPLTYIHGYAQIVPGLEKRLEGLHAGDRKTFVLPAEEAFGERDAEAILAVDKADFPESGTVSAGDEFMAKGPDGEPLAMRVIEVQDDLFVVDVNHPLAGQQVRFEVEVSSVRPASEEEIAKAQAELEERIEADDDECSCGHDHDAPHEHPEHARPETDESLVQLSKKMLS